MAIVQFYEKPGCVNNTRQKALLCQSGHQVVEHDLLSEEWTVDSLRRFLAPGPVVDWFNPTAPLIRDRVLEPERLHPEEALAAMVAEPLLIRRPLLEVEGVCHQGFDAAVIEKWIGLGGQAADADLESCPF